MKNTDSIFITQVLYVLLVKLKLGVVIIVSTVIAAICFRFGIPTDQAEKWLRDHLEYITCGPVGTTVALASQTQSDYSNWEQFMEQKIAGLMFLIFSVTLTFFLTKWLKGQFPDKPVTIPEPPNSEGDQL